MKKEIKEKWINALLSGKYQQGNFCLRYSESYCCLGVLCDLAKDDLKVDWTKRESDYDRYSFLGGLAMPPIQVIDWAGNISFDAPIINNTVHMNDTGNSFKEIAEYIKDNMPEE